jgi:hypothetical protein
LYRNNTKLIHSSSNKSNTQISPTPKKQEINWDLQITYTQDFTCINWNFETTWNEEQTAICLNDKVLQWEQWSWSCVEDICSWNIPEHRISNATTQRVWTNWTYNTTPWKCTYICQEYRSGTDCNTAEANIFTCATKSANTIWNSVDSYTQTWDLITKQIKN